MQSVIIRELRIEDESAFLEAMLHSKKLHHPWVRTPITSQDFREYISQSQQPNQKSYLVCDNDNHIIGVFNISEIVYGIFQNAYLGFYVVADYAGKGCMSAGLKLVLNKIFTELELHRVEANIQPQNVKSINLVKRNGFRKEGYSPRYLKIDAQWRDHERWAITYEDWIDINRDISK